MKKQAHASSESLCRINWSQAWAAIAAAGLTLLGLFILDLFYFAMIWPNWQELEQGSIPKSRYINDYQITQQVQWQPLAGPFPNHLTRPFIIAEDSRFYQHSGFDLQAIEDAMRINWQAGRWVYGASTISQQTVKNLFLSHERSLVRKWHELVLTIAMEKNLSKKRILALYLNIAEFGPGIFGVEAAARYYFGTGFNSLNSRQAAALAATLPSPRRHNPKTVTRFFQTKQNRIIAVLNLPPESPPESQVIEPIFPPENEPENSDDLPVADHFLPLENQASSFQSPDGQPDFAIGQPTEAEENEQSTEPLTEGAIENDIDNEVKVESSQEFPENFDPSSEYD